ncbi:1,4-alpha-glucan branching protein GlgB [Corynebacterium sp. TAE3-ERU12]|uniref:1,4-alpha-glucan branching protein GlgB n=1 Tax=Corynebacterium sp. TAE3-ERU12 TaxID=2849491 RepID=UPI001C438116|nr:1,4-alpha-glucan branching protein GlgB [Corynebacterium sp. TAE3-ERU12]MBV7295121.1 1,4-alpha-glucan branching protein GlgB [Corynebacterium sp. TAE3-ERU12]
MTSPSDPRLGIPEGDLERLRSCSHHAPHDFYGAHVIDGDTIVRSRIFGAAEVVVVTDRGEYPAEPIGDDIFAALIPGTEGFDYRLRIQWSAGGSQERADGYSFLPTVREGDLHLIAEGRHERLWEALGARPRSYDTALGTVTGTSFAVWAPNARGVAVVGDFCMWNGAQFPMRSMGSSGVWELFIPGVEPGDVYKFAITTHEGHRIDKADPMAFEAEIAPSTGSVVTQSEYSWNDDDWMARRSATNWQAEPMSVYEVHLGSWKNGLSFETLTEHLVAYVVEMGYTHVEFMPVAEHPFSGSWGYQVSGYYAPTARFGTPDQLRALIDAFHQAGIGVIVDWVPGHFPKDEWALARFDGTACYEHPDWRRGEQRDWGTYVFDFGRNEVRNFLYANALFWAEEYHIDGIRVDAVASMLYLDYSREEGEWLPNQYGGREHLEAVQFLQEFNATVHKHFPGFLTIAEESTSWPGVTTPTDQGGLGFSMKWNMGWMNDTLEYFAKDPIHRSYHHNDLTFSMVYAYSEKFVLPFSHDEVVHGKGSLWTRMPGDNWNKAAGLRTLLAYQWTHPGKQLLFMGQDLGQEREWNHDDSVAWDDLEGWGGEFHRGVQLLVRDMNAIYKDNPALFTQDDQPQGFRWINADDSGNSVLSYLRMGSDGSKIAVILNLAGVTHPSYRLGLPDAGTWSVLLNTDAHRYQGAGFGNEGQVHTEAEPWNGFEQSADLFLPAMSATWLRYEG